ncbi:hypothetical protein ES708_28471 [subsurface metagenome]
MPSKALAPYVTVLTPSGATRSGFTLPSFVGPRELNDSSVVGSSQGTAPTAIAFGESAGMQKLLDAV